MKRWTLVALIAAMLILVVALAGFAHSDDNSAAAKSGAAKCARFVDANNDGVCDSSAVCHKDGKCQGGCKNCADFKDANGDGKCDVTNCAKHKAGAAAGAACPSMVNGTCKKTGKACPGHK